MLRVMVQANMEINGIDVPDVQSGDLLGTFLDFGPVLHFQISTVKAEGLPAMPGNEIGDRPPSEYVDEVVNTLIPLVLQELSLEKMVVRLVTAIFLCCTRVEQSHCSVSKSK